jgi:copper resistance protein C
MRLPLPYRPTIGQQCCQALHGAPLCPLVAIASPAREGMKVPKRRLIWLLPCLAALLLPTFAKAHAILEESTPPAGTSVTAGSLDVRFRYNSRIDRGRSRLTLIGPDRHHDTIPILSDGPPNIIAAHLSLTPGSYLIRWQVLAVDGHITRGDVPIIVTAP